MMLELLPPPPPGKTGWPWTEESDAVPSLSSDGKPLPRISIVTPSYNQAHYLEETIRSVLLQNYPDLEYIIIDGGSSDSSVDIILKYEKWLAWWVSGKDKGQSDAINKGFSRAAGTYGNWICSDDLLCKNALNNLAGLAAAESNRLFIGRGIRIDGNGVFLNEVPPSGIRDFYELADIGRYWRKHDSIMQQACLFPLDAFRETGGLTQESHFTMDYELWGRLLRAGIKVRTCDFRVGIFRWYEGQKTSALHSVTTELVRSAFRLVSENKELVLCTALRLRLKISYYYISYQYHRFRSFLGLRRRLRILANG